MTYNFVQEAVAVQVKWYVFGESIPKSAVLYPSPVNTIVSLMQNVTDIPLP
jgi:hypothetical protein